LCGDAGVLGRTTAHIVTTVMNVATVVCTVVSGCSTTVTTAERGPTWRQSGCAGEGNTMTDVATRSSSR